MAAADAPAVRTGGVWSSCSPRASARGGGIPWPEERRKTRMDKSLTRATPSPHPSGAPTWPRGQGVSLSTVRLVTYRTCTLDGPNHILEGQRRASACATEGAGRATGPHRPARGAQRKGWWPLPRRPHTHTTKPLGIPAVVSAASPIRHLNQAFLCSRRKPHGGRPPPSAREGGGFAGPRNIHCWIPVAAGVRCTTTHATAVVRSGPMANARSLSGFSAVWGRSQAPSGTATCTIYVCAVHTVPHTRVLTAVPGGCATPALVGSAAGRGGQGRASGTSSTEALARARTHACWPDTSAGEYSSHPTLPAAAHGHGIPLARVRGKKAPTVVRDSSFVVSLLLTGFLVGERRLLLRKRLASAPPLHECHGHG